MVALGPAQGKGIQRIQVSEIMFLECSIMVFILLIIHLSTLSASLQNKTLSNLVHTIFAAVHTFESDSFA